MEQREGITMYRIFIVEDDEIISEVLKKNLSSWGYDVSCAEDFSNIIQEFVRRDPQLVLLDLKLPFYNGFHWCEEIRRISQVPVIFISSAADNMNMVMAMSRGADDFIAKPFDMDELIARIASLIRRYTRFNHQAGAVQKLDFDGLQIDLENRSVTTENGTFELPPKEFDLLLYCAKHQGKILTKQQIYEEVWGEEYFYDDSNIMAIISRLRKKLEVNPSSPKYIQTVKGIGYRFNKEV